jgi:hypothetical protein
MRSVGQETRIFSASPALGGMPVSRDGAREFAGLIAVQYPPAREIVPLRKEGRPRFCSCRPAIVIPGRQPEPLNPQNPQHFEKRLIVSPLETAFKKIAGNDQSAYRVRAGGADERLHFLQGAARRDGVAEPLARRTVAKMDVGQHSRRRWLVQGDSLWQQQPIVEESYH